MKESAGSNLSAARILMVDDSVMEFMVLQQVLKRGTPWELEHVDRGAKALERLGNPEKRYDLMLLDLMMPEMDGFQVLEHLNKLPHCSEMPIIVLTGSAEQSDQIRALSLGASEYLMKPFQPEIARLRIRNLLEIRRSNERLHELAEERAKQLVHADRLVSLGSLAAGMAHEINNPLTFLSGNLQILDRFARTLQDELKDTGTWKPSRRIVGVLEELPAMIADMRKGTARVAKIVSSLKTFSRAGNKTTENVDLHHLLTEAQLIVGHLLRGVQLEADLIQQELRVDVNSQEVEQVLVNLLANACDAVREKHTEESKTTASIAIESWEEKGIAYIAIRDNGPGLPPDKLARIGTPFFTTKPVGKGTGLGLSISYGIIRAHGGDIAAANHPEGGAVFVLSLPLSVELGRGKS